MEHINFAFVADRNQIDRLAPLIRSLEFFHHACCPEYYVLTAPNVDHTSLEASLGSVQGRLHFLVDPDPIVEHYFAFDRVTEATFLKISLFRYLPREVGRFLYCDIDMVCNGTLIDAWDSLKEHAFCAVPSPWTSLLDENGIWNPVPGKHIICPGFFGANRTLAGDVYGKAKAYVESKPLSDQTGEIDALCSVMGTDFFPLPQYYQFCVSFVTDNRTFNQCKFQRYLEICTLQNIRLIHYVGKQKPWNSATLYYKEWNKWKQPAEQ